MSYTTWADYRLELYDGSRTLLCVLDDAINLRYRRRLFGGGDFSFSLHILSSHASYLTTTGLHYIRVWRRNVCIFDGVIYKTSRKYKQSGRGLVEYIDVVGVRLGAAVASWRVGFSNSPTGRFTVTDLVDDGFKFLVSKTHGSGAYTISGARAITGFTVAANKGERAGNIELDATGVNMYEFLDRWGRYYEVDWDITFDASMNFVFETYYPRRGVDRTTDNGVVVPVIMNDAGEELTEVDYFADAVGYVNAIIGETLDIERIDTTGITAYERREMVAGTSESEALKILLADKNIHIGYKQGYAETASCRYVTDWDVGDLVTYNNLHLGLAAADTTIVEAVAQINKQGQEELTVCYGDYPRGEEARLRGTGAGGGGGYGDTPGGKTARLWGLRGDSNTWVKPDDANCINIIGGTGMDVTEGTNTLTVTCTLTGFAAHDIVGAYHTVTGSAMQLVGVTAANTLGLLTPSSAPGATSSVLKTDASGNLTIAGDLTGGVLKLVDGDVWSTAGGGISGIVAAGWAFTIMVSGGGQFVFEKLYLRPAGDNSIAMGRYTFRWSNIFTVGFTHFGTTMTVRGVEYTLPSANAAGVLTNNGSGTLGWTGPAYASHAHSISYSNTATGSTQPSLSGHTDNWATYGSTNWSSNPVCDSSGTTLYLYCSYSSSGSNPFWYIGRIGATPHYHNLSGGDANAAVASHTHTYDKAQSTTGGPS